MTGDLADSPQAGSSVTDSSDLIWPHAKPDNTKRLLIAASRRLESIEDLLLDPTPQHIQDAERLFELAAEDIQALPESCQFPEDADEYHAYALAFQATSRRILALLNGALRVHWHRLRRMGSYHETYTAAGQQKVCVPRLPRLDLKM